MMLQLSGQLHVLRPLAQQLHQCAQLQTHQAHEALIAPDVVLIQHAAGEVFPHAGILWRKERE